MINVAPGTAIEIPPKTKQRLGLDSECSWIICSEVNKFIWPGPDLRPVSRQEKDRFDYGFLPPALFRNIKNRLHYLRSGKKLRVVAREE